MADISITPTPAASPRRPLFLADLPAGPDGRPALRRILIANRGEIACRVIATCKKHNLVSIAVYVDEDSSSLHVREADESIRIGSMSNSQHGTNPFLDAALLVRTAVAARADAVHPGYGYLSEDAAFARLVRAAGLAFVGPSPLALSTLGNKRAAKAHLARHAPDVPLVPGFAGASQDADELVAAAGAIGYPVVLKAAAGGGGKGLRVVRAARELRDALERARSEARRSFGEADCILEKYVDAAKHVEMQVVGDAHGKVVCLWERDCSVQRRHQKIVEETPCAWLDEDMRRAMAGTAVRVAELIGYEGAGTVEFVVDVEARKYYFLEVNARLQVEHPITEELTGLDIVSLQLFVAAGGRLDSLPALNPVLRNGHAIECRLCAEDPNRDFLPGHGTVRLWHPALDSDTRFETAIQTGSEISIYFDSMIAKIIVWAPTRLLALEKMIRVLAQTACVGVGTNQCFLQSCLKHPAFRDPAYTTSFIQSNLESLLRNPDPTQTAAPDILRQALPCLYLRHLRARSARPFQRVRRGFRNQRCDPINQHANIIVSKEPAEEPSPNPRSPSICIFQQASSTDQNRDTYHFRLIPVPAAEEVQESPKGHATRRVTARYNALSGAIRACEATGPAVSTATVHSVAAILPRPSPDGWASHTVSLSVDGQKLLAHLTARVDRDDSAASQTARPQTVYAHVPALGTWAEHRVYSLLSFAESQREAVESAEEGARASAVKAPMPCRVLKVLKGDGEDVVKGENVMVVESMKMEMNIAVPVEGKFRTSWAQGDAVADGDVLCWVD